MELLLKPLVLIIFSVVWSSTFHFYRCQGDNKFAECRRSYECGQIKKLHFPFWGANRPSYCGYPDFKVSCDSQNRSVFKVRDLEYIIYNISHSNQNIRVIAARLDLLEGPCSPNVKFETGSLTYQYDVPISFPPEIENVTLFYGCPQTSDLTEPFGEYKFLCPTQIKGSTTVYYANDSLLQSGRLDQEDLQACTSFRVSVHKDSLLESRAGLDGNGWKRGFEVVYPEYALCKGCQDSGGTCGYDRNATQYFSCFCSPNQKQRTSYCERPGKPGLKKFRLFVLIGAPTLGIVITVVACITIFCYRKRRLVIRMMSFWKKVTNDDKDLETFFENYGHLPVKRYRFSEVKKITKSFKHKLGKGGYGEVFMGKLQDERLVAVKLLSESKGNGQEFINEVASISRTSHVNIVSLLGFCLDDGRRALIYEFMSNGSLEKFIYNDNHLQSIQQLEWDKLLKIAIGIARGLEYLHHGCNTKILHFDIKPHNILLDEDLCPKISDFGLARICLKKESILSSLNARGTIGYIAPEVFNRNFGRASSKSDVYSYGMMIIEMAGLKNIKDDTSKSSESYFPDFIYKHLEEGRNLTMWGAMTRSENEIVRKMIIVGLWCIQTMPSARPSMKNVIEMLEGNLEALDIPPKPSLFTPITRDILPTELVAESSTTSLVGIVTI